MIANCKYIEGFVSKLCHLTANILVNTRVTLALLAFVASLTFYINYSSRVKLYFICYI